VRWSSSRVSSCGSSRRMTRRVRLENLHRKKQQVAPHVLITHHAPHTTRIMHHTSIHIYIYIYMLTHEHAHEHDTKVLMCRFARFAWFALTC
jgi:hypothetical protein